MRAELKRLHSPDITKLDAYTPNPPNEFQFLLQFVAGPMGEPGEESFDVLVTTPDWLKKYHQSTDILIGRHLLIVFEYDYGRLLQFITHYCESCTGDTWKDVASNLGRLGRWEFEDYQSD